MGRAEIEADIDRWANWYAVILTLLIAGGVFGGTEVAHDLGAEHPEGYGALTALILGAGGLAYPFFAPVPKKWLS